LVIYPTVLKNKLTAILLTFGLNFNKKK